MEILQPPTELSATPQPSARNVFAGTSELFLSEPYVIEPVRDALGFARLRREWGELLERSDAGLFNAWEWLFPWWHRIGSDREPWILTARDLDGALVGLLPLALERRRVAGRRVRRLAFLGETHVGSDYLDVVAARGLEEPIARAFGSAIAAAHPGWDVLDLTDLPEGSPTLAAVRDAFAEEIFEARVTERFLCPCERFGPGETFESFLQRTARRDNYLRRRKWLERQEGFRIELARGPDGLARPLAEFQRLHALRWEADGGSQGIKGPSVEAFHRDATQWLAERGKLRLYTMYLGERALASVYGLVHHGEFIYFQSGYDPEWRNKSVGLVLVGETFRGAFEEGLGGYDFLRGTETYKSDWTRQQRRTVALRIHLRDGAGAWFTSHEQFGRRARDAVKSTLPETLVERVRRLRRRRAAI